MKTLKQIIAETVNPPKSPDERRFIAKHCVDVIDHPVATDAQETGGKTAKDRSRKADREKPEDEIVYEGYRLVMVSKDGERFKSGIYDDKKKADDAHWKAAKTNKWKSIKVVKESAFLKSFEEADLGIELDEMSDARMKKREEIVKSMKKNQADFKKRYGDDWKNVMYATATKQAMKEEMIFEAKIASSMKLKDGSSVKLSEDDQAALKELFKELNGSNRKRMESRMMESEKGFKEILQFAKEAM